MRHSFRVLLGLGLALGAAACSDYLSGPGISSTSDPNNITNLTKPGPLYVAIQQAGAPQREGQLARDATQYVQQVAGISRQSIGFDRYQTSPGDVDTYFGAVYGASNVLTGGGALLDVHKMQQLSRKVHDSLYVGIGKVYEALIIGYAADIWGDIPYREAADSNIPHPHFDPQLQIYADLQTQLDSAINVFLPATGASNIGGSIDGSELVYGGRGAGALRTVYTAVAHSLKARYYMHTGLKDPTAYTKAAAEAALGISTPDDDFLWFHDASATGTNVWWQYLASRAGDIGPGAALIEILKRRNAAGVEDTLRLSFYFTRADTVLADSVSSYFGYRPAGTTNLVTSGGIDPGNGLSGAYSDFGAFVNPAAIGSDGSFRQPEITYAETQLIAAEAAWHIGCPACTATTVVAGAQTNLTNARTNRHYGSQSFGNAPGVLSPTLQNIIEEKYTTLFLNPEVWNDFKRTCLPSLAPTPAAGAVVPGAAPIPGRLPYGQTEVNANPNAPTTNSVGVAVTAVGLNPNQPTSCPVLNYTRSVPLAN
jgi:hypothetical protein